MLQPRRTRSRGKTSYVEFPDGTPLVVLELHSPTGHHVAFLPCAAAEQLAETLARTVADARAAMELSSRGRRS